MHLLVAALGALRKMSLDGVSCADQNTARLYCRTRSLPSCLPYRCADEKGHKGAYNEFNDVVEHEVRVLIHTA